jgi:catechol 2,3-dioxygenase-like lactoylglutathione lyase family enzyme
MLGDFRVTATIPVTDIDKARNFYVTKLGLKENPKMKDSDGILFSAGEGTDLYIYKRGPSKADHTLATFKVDDIETLINELFEKGISFEHYDMPNGLKTNEKGIATMGSIKSAWFKDPDGNILALIQTD